MESYHAGSCLAAIVHVNHPSNKDPRGHDGCPNCTEKDPQIYAWMYGRPNQENADSQEHNRYNRTGNIRLYKSRHHSDVLYSCFSAVVSMDTFPSILNQSGDCESGMFTTTAGAIHHRRIFTHTNKQTSSIIRALPNRGPHNQVHLVVRNHVPS